MDTKLLDKFFKGECSAEEYKEVITWYISGEADKDLSEKLEANWRSSGTEIKEEWGKEVVFQEIFRKIKGDARHEMSPDNYRDEFQVVIENQLYPHERKIVPIWKNNRSHWKKWAQVAAVFLPLIFGTLYFFTDFKAWLPSEQISSKSNDKYFAKETSKGEKLTLALSDGSVVKLNSDSRIRYREMLDESGVREVFLEGEAFFEVAKDSLRPFIVHTGSLTTTVLGTSFNINAYSSSELAVSVVSGKVKVQNTDEPNRESVLLLPEEQAYYSSRNAVLIKRKFDYPHVLSWKDGTIYFKDAKFPEVIHALERWYGVDFEIRNENIEDGFSGAYTNKSLESVLSGMSYVLNFDFQIKGKKVIIK